MGIEQHENGQKGADGKKNIVMIAYAFPPLNYSGTERPFQFAKHLPSYGYMPQVISQKNYINYQVAATETDKLDELDPNTTVYRFATIKSQLENIPVVSWLDHKIHQLTGKVQIMSRILHLPVSFSLGNFEWEWRSILKVVSLKWSKKITLIWATGPAWQDLTVGYWASRLTGLPYVMDLRDPMTYGLLWQPKTEKEAKKLLRRERRYFKQASKVIFTSPLTEENYLHRYPKALQGKTLTITNGFDTAIEVPKAKPKSNKFILSYIGRLTTGIRDPKFFLEGYKLACKDEVFAKNTQLRMIGYMHDFKEQLEEVKTYSNMCITDVVPRQKSIEMMLESDALLILQSIEGEGADVISGKLFEYLNAQKYVIGVVDDKGGDAWLIKQTNTGVVTGLKEVSKVAEALLTAYDLWKNNQLLTSNNVYKTFQRSYLTKQLAKVFNEITDSKELHD